MHGIQLCCIYFEKHAFIVYVWTYIIAYKQAGTPNTKWHVSEIVCVAFILLIWICFILV